MQLLQRGIPNSEFRRWHRPRGPACTTGAAWTQETLALLKKKLDLTKVFTRFPLIYWIVNFIGMHVPRFEKNESFRTVYMEELNLVH
jgi:hypothetical protein